MNKSLFCRLYQRLLVEAKMVQDRPGHSHRLRHAAVGVDRIERLLLDGLVQFDGAHGRDVRRVAGWNGNRVGTAHVRLVKETVEAFRRRFVATETA